MTDSLHVACVQLRTGRDMTRNIAEVCDLITQAAAAGASFIATPETTHLMELSSKALFAQVQSQDEDPGLRAFRALAKDLSVWLLIGSLAIRLSDQKVANRSFVIDSNGDIVATYDKIHMFDVDLAGGESYRESKNYQAGDQAVMAHLPSAKLGLTICYDLRFPYLYRMLAQAGADIISVPAAFTRPTGEAHWEVLLRARAIETGCFVVAPAQGGTHENGRETYGHSLIVSPWGEVLAEAGTDPGVITAQLDLADVAAARAKIPALQHDRPVAPPF